MRIKYIRKMWIILEVHRKASSTMTPNKVVSQFDPAIILEWNVKAIKGDMKLKKTGSVYRVSYSGNSLRF